MGLLSRIADTGYSFRFLRLLTTPWDQLGAFKAGIIDENGKNLIRARDIKSSEDKSTYTLFHRLVFNVKRLLGKIPLGKSRIASYAAALLLIKEQTGLKESEIVEILVESNPKLDLEMLSESLIPPFIQENGNLTPGTYILKEDILDPSSDKEFGFRERTEVFFEDSFPSINIFGAILYCVEHVSTGKSFFVSSEDIEIPLEDVNSSHSKALIEKFRIFKEATTGPTTSSDGIQINPLPVGPIFRRKIFDIDPSVFDGISKSKNRMKKFIDFLDPHNKSHRRIMEYILKENPDFSSIAIRNPVTGIVCRLGKG